MEVDGDEVLLALKPLRQMGRQCLVQALLQDCQFLDGQLGIEVLAEGLCVGSTDEIGTDGFEALPGGANHQEGIVERLAGTFVAVGLKRQVGFDDGSGLLQGLLVGQFWRIVGHGLVLLVIVSLQTNNLQRQNRPITFSYPQPPH